MCRKIKHWIYMFRKIKIPVVARINVMLKMSKKVNCNYTEIILQLISIQYILIYYLIFMYVIESYFYEIYISNV